MRHFKKDGKAVVSQLQALTSEELQVLAAQVASQGTVDLLIAPNLTMELRPELLEIEKVLGNLLWLPVLQGHLACDHKPGQKVPCTPKNWRQEGATVVVNLLKVDEDAKSRVKERCEE